MVGQSSRSWVQKQPPGAQVVAYTRVKPGADKLLSTMSLRSLGQVNDAYADIFFVWGPDSDEARVKAGKEPTFFQRSCFVLPALVVPPPVITRGKDIPGVTVRETPSIVVQTVTLDWVLLATVPVYYRVICFQKPASKFPTLVTRGDWPQAGFRVLRGFAREYDVLNKPGGLFLTRQKGTGSTEIGHELDTVDGEGLSGTIDSMHTVVKYDSGVECVEFTPVPPSVLGCRRIARRFQVTIGELVTYEDDSSWKPSNDSYFWVVYV